MSTPFTIAQKNNLPVLDSQFFVVELGHAGTPSDFFADLRAEINIEFAAAGETPPQNLRAVLISNDHASHACYLSSKFMRSAVDRGICLEAGDAIFLALGSGEPGTTNSFEYGSNNAVTLSVACFY